MPRPSVANFEHNLDRRTPFAGIQRHQIQNLDILPAPPEPEHAIDGPQSHTETKEPRHDRHMQASKDEKHKEQEMDVLEQLEHLASNDGKTEPNEKHEGGPSDRAVDVGPDRHLRRELVEGSKVRHVEGDVEGDLEADEVAEPAVVEEVALKREAG